MTNEDESTDRRREPAELLARLEAERHGAGESIAIPQARSGAHRQLDEPLLCSDRAFDSMLPAGARAASSLFWTPVSVAARAARLLVTGPRTRVLDIGSGVGKFCIVGAASTVGHFVGIEQRGHLVRIAEETARRIGVERTQFVHGTVDAVRCADFDAFYLYNPFEENLCGSDERLDDTVSLSEERFCADVERVQTIFGGAPVGTRVVTFNGFGGDMPADYRLVTTDSRWRSYLDLWVKMDPRIAAQGKRALDVARSLVRWCGFGSERHWRADKSGDALEGVAPELALPSGAPIIARGGGVAALARRRRSRRDGRGV